MWFGRVRVIIQQCQAKKNVNELKVSLQKNPHFSNYAPLTKELDSRLVSFSVLWSFFENQKAVFKVTSVCEIYVKSHRKQIFTREDTFW